MILQIWKIVWELLRKLKIQLTMWFNHFTLRDLPKRKESICPYKDLYMNIYSSFIYNTITWKPFNCPSTGQWINKLCYSFREILLSSTEQWTTTTSGMDGVSGENPPANAEDLGCGFESWVRKIPWRRAWQPTPVFLPEKAYRQRSLAGYSA